ncbi:MAG: tetratricopeptide repeat protein [Bacteroidota bacterium]
MKDLYQEVLKYIQENRYAEALNILTGPAQRMPENSDPAFQTGLLHLQRTLADHFARRSEYSKALELYKSVLSFLPQDAGIHYNTAFCLQSLNDFHQAIIHYEKAVSLRSGYKDALNNLGLLYVRFNRFEDAEKAFSEIIAADPGNIRAYDNLGYLKLTEGSFEEAEKCFIRVFELTGNKDHPANAVTYGNMGFVSLKKNDIAKSLEHFNEALRLNPELAQAHYNRAEALLLDGNLQEGFAEYEWRMKKDDWIERNLPGKPLTPGTDVRGKRILVLAEQGFGDSIQFVRYLSRLKSMGAFVILECSSELYGLFEYNKLADLIIRKDEQSFAGLGIEYCIYLLSLPYFFSTTIQSVPSSVRYISAQPDMVRKWSSVFAAGRKIKIGIVWAGSQKHSNDRNRSCSLSEFAGISRLPDVELYSLQKGPAASQITDIDFPLTILDHYGLDSFAETAAAIENLDMVISVDTSVAHLAAAMGKPVWLLLPYAPDWRWLLHREDSPWYPSIKIFRQQYLHVQWRSVFEVLEQELAQQIRRITHPAGIFQKDTVSILRGIALESANSGNYTQAKSMFDRILEIEQDNDSALFNAGLCLQLQGDLAGAEKYYRRAVSVNPENQGALLNIGVLLVGTGKYAEALQYLEKYTAYAPDDYNAYYNIGVCYQHLEDNNNAIVNYLKVISMQPSHAASLSNVGLLYSEQKDYVMAEKYLAEAMSCNPEYLNGINNMGHVKLKQNKLEEAWSLFERAISIMPRSDYRFRASMLNNLGVVKFKQGDFRQAIELYDEALKTDPDSVSAHTNKASVLLLLGKFTEGWKEYEWRMEKSDWGKRKLKNPLPDDRYISGRKILVYGEQGYGDTIQFVRYLPILKKLGCTVIFECERALIPLFENLACIDRLIERNISECPDIDYDYDIGLLSLPGIFNTDLASVPAEIPYVFADKELSRKWSDLINDDDSYLKAGIVWAGSPMHVNDLNRSCGLENFEAIFDIPGIKYFSLQKGPGLLEIGGQGKNFVNLDELQMNTFADTAAVIDNLDLVITVDTAVAHLAAAMGKPVWILLAFVPDWRWMLNTNSSVWYPTVRLYRQPVAGDWKSVFNRLRKDLQDFRDGNTLTCKTDAALPRRNNNELQPGYSDTIFLGLANGDNFGWGVCSKYLRSELSKFRAVKDIQQVAPEDPELSKGLVFQALMNIDLDPLFQIKGSRNIGYTFFEQELTGRAVENSEKFDLVLGGSAWNMQKLQDRGIMNSGYLVQGIDPSMFYPEETSSLNRDLFVIFSGGKFELRKGQDIVLRAFSILHRKYPDMILINAWYNFWPVTMNTMSLSKHIQFELPDRDTWTSFVNKNAVLNGIDASRMITLPLVENQKLREIYLKSDIGLFPNRCEGGTNLVLMEYMACGRPVIASYNTGHKDVLSGEHAFLLRNMHEQKIYDTNNNLWAEWYEPDIDEVIAAIEYAYFNRSELRQKGTAAGLYMKNFTWQNTAARLIEIFKGVTE